MKRSARIASLVAGLRPKAWLILALTFSSLVACEKGRVYERFASVGPEWSWDEVHRFSVDVKDTAALYNLFVNIRHDADYGYLNCWLQIRTITPAGDSSTNRLNIPLAEKDGTWLGQCALETCTQRELIGDRRRFPESGIYVFELAQDMRENPLPGLRDVGIRIEKLGIK